MFLQVLNQRCYRRSFLANCNVDAINRLSGLIEALLVDDGVDCDGRLSSLAVADNKLTLTSSDRNH